MYQYVNISSWKYTKCSGLWLACLFRSSVQSKIIHWQSNEFRAGPQSRLWMTIAFSDAITYCFSCSLPVQRCFLWQRMSRVDSAQYITSQTGMMVFVQLFLDTLMKSQIHLCHDLSQRQIKYHHRHKQIVAKRTGKKTIQRQRKMRHESGACVMGR